MARARQPGRLDSLRPKRVSRAEGRCVQQGSQVSGKGCVRLSCDAATGMTSAVSESQLIYFTTVIIGLR